MKTQAYNPFLPGNEYIPDGEPHVFGDRVYLYGSHDRFGGSKFCMNDYVCWSAPTDNLGAWRFEGEIYRRTQDPNNRSGKLELWAPDVAQGPDGRFYLYYCLANDPQIGVAVCDVPNGTFEFLGQVCDENGGVIGRRKGDTMPFDPAVLMDDDGHIWLYAGNGPASFMPDPKKKKASVCMELHPDMLTVKGEIHPLIPTLHTSVGTGFEGREFFEASSIRKFDGRYYFIYSSVKSHELCWAVSDRPDGGFAYGGVLVSNGDIRPEDGVSIDFSGKANPAIRNYIGNNHGSIVEINGAHYIFYHRHTNRNMYSRQACAERIEFRDGRFLQAELTSCGLNGASLKALGTYEARIACHLYSKQGALFSAHPLVQNRKHPAFTQDRPEGKDSPQQLIENLRDGSTAGFRYFDFRAEPPDTIRIIVRGKCNGEIVVRNGQTAEVLARIMVSPSKDWRTYQAPLANPEGVQPLYFTYSGKGYADFMSFTLAGKGET